MDWKEKLAIVYGKEKFLNKNQSVGESLPKSLADAVYKPQRTTGRHALKTYKGIVTYPISRGGGSVWMKSEVALRNYEAQGCKVVWL